MVECNRMLLFAASQVVTAAVNDSSLDRLSLIANIAVALGTVGLAFFTAFLAWQTRRQAIETGALIAQAERHHEQSFLPYLKAVEGIGSIRPVRAMYSNHDVHAFNIDTRLSNLGHGIAINIRLYIRLNGTEFESVNRWTRKAPAIPPIGLLGDSVTLQDWGIEVITTVDADSAKWEDAAFIVAYDDVFGRTYRTIYDGKTAVRFEGIERLATSKAMRA